MSSRYGCCEMLRRMVPNYGLVASSVAAFVPVQMSEHFTSILKKASARLRGLIPLAGSTLIKVHGPANRSFESSTPGQGHRRSRTPTWEGIVATKNLPKKIKKELARLSNVKAPNPKEPMTRVPERV